MKVVVLASGSKGNSTYIESNNTKILIDLGMSSNYIEEKLRDLNVNPKDINAILITHTHNDHIAGLKSFNKKFKTPIFISPKMEEVIRNNVREPIINYIKKEMTIENVNIKVIKNSHDTESYGYIFDEKLVYITDTGYINVKYFDMLLNKDMYILESNHDIELLQNGKYSHYLKQRILSDKGHLSNELCSYYLSKLIGSNTKYIVLAHLSEENNTKELAYETLKNKIPKLKPEKIIISSQKESTKVVEI
jgi:phosphoribosyl 1,2-cyclic phosphodiesterase